MLAYGELDRRRPTDDEMRGYVVDRANCPTPETEAE
jgi:hypothetical protein